ncbi:MAG: hypothetical protein Q8903_09980, partial [Bacteroidota bacterium]|nr:hypothetical protein [Bacteroidota bacterium]
HYSLKEFEVTLIPGKEVQLVKIKNSEDEGRNWSLFSFELLPNYKAAAAVRLKECRMSVSKYTGHLVA